MTRECNIFWCYQKKIPGRQAYYYCYMLCLFESLIRCQKDHFFLFKYHNLKPKSLKLNMSHIKCGGRVRKVPIKCHILFEWPLKQNMLWWRHDDVFVVQAPASGWGLPTDDATSISPVLREVVTETITNLVCRFELITISANNICISGKGGKSTCNVSSLNLRNKSCRMCQIFKESKRSEFLLILNRN